MTSDHARGNASNAPSPNDCYQQNLQAIVDYFAAAEQNHATEHLLGLEVEHFVIFAASQEPLTYYRGQKEVGAQDLLHYLASFYPQKTYSAQGELMGLAAKDGAISLEPSCQLEISVAPYESLARIEQAYGRFRTALEPFLARYGLELATFGYHPSRQALAMALIPKERYYYMDRFFNDLGTLGMRMMRTSASTQVSVDYANEADAVRKMRVAAALGPILAAIADNTPVYEGEPNRVPLKRFELWRNVDDARCRIVPGTFAPGFGFLAYARWLLGVTPIFIKRKDAAGRVKTQWAQAKPAAELYRHKVMDRQEIEHLQSMVWPDVRLKRFVEIRPADSLPAPLSLGYTALIKGLFYSNDNLGQVEEWLGVKGTTWPFGEQDVEALIPLVQQNGFAAKLYGVPLAAWISRLFALASGALLENERHYLEPLQAFVQKNMTL